METEGKLLVLQPSKELLEQNYKNTCPLRLRFAGEGRYLQRIISEYRQPQLPCTIKSWDGGTRIDAGKRDCLVIDLAGNVERFGKVEDICRKGRNVKTVGINRITAKR